MFLKTLLVFVVIIGLAVLLLNVKALFKKNGKLEKSCTAEKRVMHKNGIDACAACEAGPLECKIDKKEHFENVHKKIIIESN